jgi:hypothetical protein
MLMAVNATAAIISRNESRGGTELMPPVYRTPRLNCWTLRATLAPRFHTEWTRER